MLNHGIGEMNSFSDTLIPFNIINMKDLFKKKFINLLISKKKKNSYVSTLYIDYIHQQPHRATLA